jgi:hypothetical protein
VAVSESHEAYLELCAGKALDVLDPKDRAAFEEHLADGCSQCEAALALGADAVLAMAATAPPAIPRSTLKKELLARVAREPQEIDPRAMPQIPERPRPPHRAPWGLVWGLAAFGLLFLALNFLNWQRGNTLLKERDTARTEADRLSHELNDVTRLVAAGQLAVLLPTPDSNQNQRGTGYFDPATGDAVLNFRNMEKPEGRDFELWALHGPKPTSLGLLHVDPNGNAFVNLKGVTDPAHLNAFAVSLEPAGGSKSDGPTGPVVLVGSIGS